MNTKDLSEIAICKKKKEKKFRNCWEACNNFSWDRTEGVDWESRLISQEIKETIYSLKNPNQISKISCMLSEMWLHNLR